MPYIGDPVVTEAGVTLLVLRTELYARGADYLAADAAGIARANRWINQAYQKVCLREKWPFRLATSGGVAPLAISDLGTIMRGGVTVPGNNNYVLDDLSETEATPLDLTATGGYPWFYYLDGQTVRTWPAYTGAISVRYYKIPAKLVDDGDTTLVPERFMDVIVDDAVRRATGKDNTDAAVVSLMRGEFDDGLNDMREALLPAPTHIRRAAFHEDA
jgi:hypothetical protein